LIIRNRRDRSYERHTAGIGHIEVVSVYSETSESVRRRRAPETVDRPFAGSNLPPFSMTFLKDDAARLNEPSPEFFMIWLTSDWPETSLFAVVVVVDILAIFGWKEMGEGSE
jgi:hypothetical protein